MKILFGVLAALVVGLGVCVPKANAQTAEVFGTATDGTVLHWYVYTPAGNGPWPAMIIIHGGGFDSNSPTSSPDSVVCGQDLAAAGYIAFSVEYRLAPPGLLRGQTSDGRFPQQNDDVRLAVRTARADSRCNGQVGAIGGSGGGYHVAYLAATGTPGDDRIEVGVSLSGVFDLSDFSPNPTLNYFTATVTNYVGVTTADTAALRAASPAWIADKTIAPLFLVNSARDPMPYVQIPDMIMHLDALGVTNYQTFSQPGQTHAFANWAGAKDQALTFLANGFAGVPPPPPLPSPGPGDSTKKLINVSTRADVGTTDNVMVGGFIITGTTNKRVVLRALGPSLTQSGLNGALSDPILELYDPTGVLMESNDNFLPLAGIPNPLQPPDATESLLTAVLPPGAYTTVLHGAGDLTGIALGEVYDVNPVSSNVANLSTRADVASSSDVIIGGFIVGGTDPTNVILRALGPSLAAYGVQSPLNDPYLELHDSNGGLLAANDNWRSTQEQEIINTTIPPTNDREAAIVATLNPGNYTAVVRDAKFGTGVTLVEAYDLEP
ncbi:MAG: alpha/beta hydrolase family protein [Chthoniobacterales bacterium]